MHIADLFDRDIKRKINPVVQVEDCDENELRTELDEYIVTEQIAKHLTRILRDGYLEKDPPGTALWISGFFGAGKSLFLKLLSLALAQKNIGEVSVIDRLVASNEDRDFRREVSAIKGRKPACVIALHMKSDAHDREQIVDILWRALHAAFGYARIPWIAEIERSLERRGLLDAFKTAVETEHKLQWDEIRTDSLLQEAILAKALLHIDGKTYRDLPAAERAIRDARDQQVSHMTPAMFTERCLDLLKEHPEYDCLFFALDEMGQFAAHDSRLLLELQAIVERFYAAGKRKLWLAATAQEQLDAVVANYGNKQDDINKIRDRFVKSLRVELSTENAERIVLERLLKKPSSKEEALRVKIAPHATWMEHETSLSDATHEFPAAKLDAVLRSYPFLPAQFRLTTLFMQGLRHDTGGTADRTAKGPRALIGVTQQIVQEIAAEEIGALVSLDRVYDAMEGSIPSEDVNVLRLLSDESKRPKICDQILRIDYMFDVIGKHLPATRTNLLRSSWRYVGQEELDDSESGLDHALRFLCEKSFLREAGNAKESTYRFLRAYQRKIEDEVREQYVSREKILEKARELTKEILQGLKIGSGRVSYEGARAFALVPIIDKDFVPKDDRLRIEVRTPLSNNEEDFDPKTESLSRRLILWSCAASQPFVADVGNLVAMKSVLTKRSERVPTGEEEKQLRRADEDLAFRENKLRERLRDTLMEGAVYVYGNVLPTTQNIADAIVCAVVEADYQGLHASPYGIEEREIASIFAAKLPKDGPLVRLRLIENATLSIQNRLCTDFLAVLERIHFQGGATGRALIEKMLESPYGYENTQTLAAAATLWKLGAIKALSSAGTSLTRDVAGEQRLTKLRDFEKLGFEREKEIDPVTLQAATNLLEQHFNRKGSNERPRVARDVQESCEEVKRSIALVQERVRDDLPQVNQHLAGLLEAVTLVLASSEEISRIETFVQRHHELEAWKTILEPVQRIEKPHIDTILKAKRLLSLRAVQTRHADLVPPLEELLDGPKPWNDISRIRSQCDRIAALVKADLEHLHAKREEELAAALAIVENRADQLQTNQDTREAARAAFASVYCPGLCVDAEDTCAGCRAGVDALPDQIAAIPQYRTTALRTLNDARQVAQVSANGAVEQSPPAAPRTRRSISAQKQACLPRILTNPNDVNQVIEALKDTLLEAIHTHGEIELGP